VRRFRPLARLTFGAKASAPNREDPKTAK
jgi:hypothetical protein